MAAVLAAGGAEPVRGRLVEVTVPAAGVRVFGGPGGVYLVENETISKYALPSARLDWRVSMSGHVVMAAGMPLVTSDGLGSRTVALDPGTGGVRWRRAGAPAFASHGGVQLLTDRRSGVDTVRYEVVDVASGATRWELTEQDGDDVFFDGDRFVRWSPSGQVEVRDMGTGRVLSTGVVPPPAGDGLPFRDVWGRRLVGDLLLVAREVGGVRVSDAYDLDRLVPRWSADIDLAVQEVSDCGSDVCVGQATGKLVIDADTGRIRSTGTRVIDADTGRVRWSTDRPGLLESVGSVMISYDITEQPPEIRILDAADGRLRADLGRWHIGWPHGDGDGDALAIRGGTDGTVWIAELDLARGRVQTLGIVRDAVDCETSWRLVVCRRPDGTTGIWYSRPR